MTPLQGGRETLWLLLALDPGYPHSAYHKCSTQRAHTAHTYPHRAYTGWTCVYTHAHRAHTVYANACTHTKGLQRLYMCTRTQLPLSYMRTCVHIHRELAQGPRLSLNEGKFLGCCVTVAFPPVKPPGYHLLALCLPTFSQPPWPPSFPPGSRHQGPASVYSTPALLGVLGKCGGCPAGHPHCVVGEQVCRSHFLLLR